MDNTTNNTNPTPNYTNLSFLDEKQSVSFHSGTTPRQSVSESGENPYSQWK